MKKARKAGPARARDVPFIELCSCMRGTPAYSISIPGGIESDRQVLNVNAEPQEQAVERATAEYAVWRPDAVWRPAVQLKKRAQEASV